MKSLKILSALSMFAVAYATDANYNDRETQEVPKDDTNRKKIYPTSKQGQNTFNYQDGFTCQALNKKNADKKHDKWLKSKN